MWYRAAISDVDPCAGEGGAADDQEMGERPARTVRSRALRSAVHGARSAEEVVKGRPRVEDMNQQAACSEVSSGE